MKVAAHPMLVAVALGLLGPGALAADTEDDNEPVVRRSVAPAQTAAASSPIDNQDSMVDALEDEDAPYWTRLTLVDADDSDGWTAG
jgi:hypothetical protein